MSNNRPSGFYPELEEFLSVPGRTLLIKGPPGVGKTTLALDLLEHLSSDGGGKEYPRGVYFSTRVPEEALKKQFPSLRFLDLHVEDLRLSTIEGFLAEVLRKVRSNSPIVVLDSWDAYAKEMDEKDRLKTEKTLVSIASTSKSRLIFVAEETRQTTLDYLVDGVVKLATEAVESRLFRVSYIKKLRGLRVNHHTRTYTLLDSSFKAFKPYEEPEYRYISKVEAIPDYDGNYSFGSHSLDEKLGGIPYGSTVAVEYSPEVPLSAVAAFGLPAAINSILLGRSVVIVPLPGVSPENLARYLLSVVGDEMFEQHVAIYHWGKPLPENFKDVFFGLSDTFEESVEEMDQIIQRLRRTSVDGRILLLRSLGVLENRFPADLSRIASLVTRRIGEAFNRYDAQIYFVESVSTLRPKVLSMCSRHFKMCMKNGVVLVFGEKPYTSLHVLEYINRSPLAAGITEIV